MGEPASLANPSPFDTITILECTEDHRATKRIRLGPGELGTVIDGYDAGTWFMARELPIGSFDELAAALQLHSGNPKAFVIRGASSGAWSLEFPVRRTSISKPMQPAAFRTQPRRWLAIDMDKVPQPAGTDPVQDPDDAIEHLRGLLPDEFQDASCWWQFTSGQGFKGDTLNARLWFWLDRPLNDVQLRTWARGQEHIDAALYSAAEPHYIAAPILGPGVRDPLPRRSGVHRGVVDEMSLRLPDVTEVAGAVERREWEGGDGDCDPMELAAMLAAIPNRDLPYDEWLSVGARVKAAAGDVGEDAFVEWSALSHKHEDGTARRKFRSLQGAGGEHGLYLMAREHGYEPFRGRGIVINMGTFRANIEARIRRERTAREVAANSNRFTIVNPAPARHAPPSIPRIQVEAGDLHRMTSQAEDALIRGGAPFYARGLYIMKPIRDEVPASKGRTTTSAKLVKVSRDATIDWLSRLSRWEKFDKRVGNGGDWVTVDPPYKVAQILEWPELRHFGARPDEAVMANRGWYVGAALTIVRAYLAAGQPGRCPDLASFEDWSRLVRSSLVWLGEADPCASMERIREEDPERSAALAVFEHLLAEFGDIQSFTAREAADVACEGSGGGGWRRPDMRDALLAVAGHGGAINTRSLGRWLVQRLNRPFDGIKVVKAAEGKNGTKFRLARG